MFRNISAEIKKISETLLLKQREEHEARRGRKGNDPIFRAVEAERVHSNFLKVIPASVILLVVEACGMIWAIITRIKFDYGTGFLISCAIFTAVAFGFVCLIEHRLKDPDFPLKQKRMIYIIYWTMYALEAMSFSVMELLDRGTVNNYLVFIFVFTVLPIIEPVPKMLALVLTFAVESGVMIFVDASPDSVILCLGAVIIGGIASYVIFFRYISIKLTEKRLEHFANGDQLTMLTNRRGFASLSPTLKKYCEKNGLRLSVLMADIDNFKKYNDTYGHVEGDGAIRAVAEKLRENFSRPTDICARYGGEEFIILSAVRDETRTLEHVKSLLSDVEESTRVINGGVTLSIGLCISEENEKIDLNKLIGVADGELYNAKNNGKNCVSFCSRIYRNE